MRGRCCFVGVFLVLLSFLCACGKQPQTVTMTSFSADLSFSSDSVEYAGVFTLKDDTDIQLMLRTPTELQGLRFVFDGETASMQFGDASVSLNDAEALGLPPAALHAMFQALSSLYNTPQTLSENGTVDVSTSRGTATVAFLPDQPMPASVSIGNVTFAFENPMPVSP